MTPGSKPAFQEFPSYLLQRYSERLSYHCTKARRYQRSRHGPHPLWKADRYLIPNWQLSLSCISNRLKILTSASAGKCLSPVTWIGQGVEFTLFWLQHCSTKTNQSSTALPIASISKLTIIFAISKKYFDTQIRKIFRKQIKASKETTDHSLHKTELLLELSPETKICGFCSVALSTGWKAKASPLQKRRWTWRSLGKVCRNLWLDAWLVGQVWYGMIPAMTINETNPI